MIEHEVEALAGDVTRGLAVDGIAEDHVVGGDGLGDGAGSAAGLEKDARDLLAGTDFGKRAVDGLVEIDRERLAVGGQEIFLIAHGRAHYGRAGARRNPIMRGSVSAT